MGKGAYQISVIFLICSLLLSHVIAEEPVYFADQYLKSIVESHLGISNPTPSDMLSLTRLNCMRIENSPGGITDLTGLEHAVNMESLKLRVHKISDISVLAFMPELHTLNLSRNEITNLSPLANLINLNSIDIHMNHIYNVTPLQNLINLETLILRYNPVTNISPLGNLTNLKHLNLCDCGISNISPLSNLTNLQELNLSINNISSISPLEGLTSLRKLELFSNLIYNLSPLTNLHNLNRLTLSHNLITDISPLTNLYKLYYLLILDNPLNIDSCQIYIPQIIENNYGITLLFDPLIECYLTVSSTVGGSVIDPGEGVFSSLSNERTLITAQADPGFVFVGWSGACLSASESAFIEIDGDCEVKAHFASTMDVMYIDDDASEDPGAGDITISDPKENGTSEHPFDSIQEAIDIAKEGSSIFVRSGTYIENIDFLGKNIQLIGSDSDNSESLSYPIIDGNGTGPIVTFNNHETSNCLLNGFIITEGKGDPASAIYCSMSSPTISNCLIVRNRSIDSHSGVIYCSESSAIIRNCTIADNESDQNGSALSIYFSTVTVNNSILWNNLNPIHVGDGSPPFIDYCNIQGGGSIKFVQYGVGNLDTDPLFADPGYSYGNNTPDNPYDDVWILGDYHLQSQTGRYDPTTQTWIQDEVSSPCIDAGDPTSPIDFEPIPNGDIINMGTYGGTKESSKSISKQ